VAHVDQEIFFGNKLYAVCPSLSISSQFIFYYCLSSEFFENFKLALTGLIGGVSIERFGNLFFPLPPLAEQKRIVKKVEEVMSLVNRLKRVIDGK
jgi:type I restriction enzyme S subunit